MADVTRQRTGELLRLLFKQLIDKPEGMLGRDALAVVASSVTMSPHEAGEYSPGTRRFETIVRFATIDTVKAGWLVKNKGHWSITDLGRAAYQKYPDPEPFYKAAVHLYDEWKSTQPEGGEDEPAVVESEPGKVSARGATRTFEVADEDAWAEIDGFMSQMNPYDFQEVVAGLLRAMGYHIAWVAPPGKDGGLDIVAYRDPLGTQAPRIKVQVKRQKSTVDVDGLRSFMAVLGDDDVGIFVNTGGFTTPAMLEARAQAKRKITLLNMEQLFDLWVDNYKSLDDKARRRMPLRPIYFLAPIE